jgi:hypothetical protein
MPECFVVIFLAALTRPHFQQKRYVIAMSLVVDFSNGANDGSPRVRRDVAIQQIYALELQFP